MSSAVATPIRPVEDPPRVAAKARGPLLPIDPLLTLAAIGLCVCSVIVIRGATANDIPGQPLYYVIRQSIYCGIGLMLMVAAARFDYSRLREFKHVTYGLMIAVLAATFALGSVSKGSRRWIELPFFNFQPSELGKLLLVLSLSAFIVDGMRNMDMRLTTKVLALAAVPALLIMAQPDLGSALVYMLGTLAVLFVAGIPWRHFAAMGALGVIGITVALVGLPAVGIEVLHGYQADRLTSFIHPDKVSGKEGYQQEQSKIAIGSGEKTGRGVHNATQTGLDFLPEHHTDFVFAVVGETYGFAGAATVLSLYALLIWRGLRILTIAKNLYGALIAGGLTVMLLFQLFVNIGMTVGIMPITGIPAPLLSFGGSSMLVTFMSLGLMQSISAQGRQSAAMKRRATV